MPFFVCVHSMYTAVFQRPNIEKLLVRHSNHRSLRNISKILVFPNVKSFRCFELCQCLTNNIKILIGNIDFTSPKFKLFNIVYIVCIVAILNKCKPNIASRLCDIAPILVCYRVNTIVLDVYTDYKDIFIWQNKRERSSY